MIVKGPENLPAIGENLFRNPPSVLNNFKRNAERRRKEIRYQLCKECLEKVAEPSCRRHMKVSLGEVVITCEKWNKRIEEVKKEQEDASLFPDDFGGLS